jgi:hypothetical protein
VVRMAQLRINGEKVEVEDEKLVEVEEEKPE